MHYFVTSQFTQFSGLLCITGVDAKHRYQASPDLPIPPSPWPILYHIHIFIYLFTGETYLPVEH